MKKTITAANGQIITAEVNDATMITDGKTTTLAAQDITLSITPVVVQPPPVVTEPPATTGLIRYMDWATKFEWSATVIKTYPARIGSGFYNSQSANVGAITNAIFPGTTMNAMKMTWQPGWAVSSSYRSEIQSIENPDMVQGTEVFIGFAWLAELWAESATWGQSIWQLHDNNGTSPSVSIHITGDQLQLVIVNKVGVYRIDIGKFIVGKRYDFVMHFKFSTDTDAVNEVWVDGVQKIPSANLHTPNLPATGGGYTKIGLNYFGATTATKTPRIAYYGPYKVGKSYNDVKP